MGSINSPIYVKRKNNIFDSYKIQDSNSESILTKKLNRNKQIEEIIYFIEKYPQPLNSLTIQQLELIDIYYKKKIIECKRKLFK